MKKITDALGLPEAADEDAIVAAIEQLKGLAQAPAESPTAKLDKRIREKMALSGGALSYEGARLAIRDQDVADAKANGGKASGPKGKK